MPNYYILYKKNDEKKKPYRVFKSQEKAASNNEEGIPDGFKFEMVSEKPNAFYKDGNYYYFPCGGSHDILYNKKKPTVGAEKEVATLNPIPMVHGHANNMNALKKYYYSRTILKYFVAMKNNNNEVKRYMLIWGEIEQTGNTLKQSIEFATGIINTSDKTAIELVREIYKMMGYQETPPNNISAFRIEDTFDLEDFAKELTSYLNQMGKIPELIKKMGKEKNGNNPKLIIAANRMFCKNGPYPLKVAGTQQTRVQIKDKSGTQLNYSMPLDNIGFMPAALIEKMATVKERLREVKTIAGLKRVLQPFLDKSFMRAFTSGDKYQPGSIFMIRAQIAAHEFVTDLVNGFVNSGKTDNGICIAKMKGIFANYFVNAAYEVYFKSDDDTTKDNLGHLIKTTVMDLVRMVTSDNEKKMLIWMTSQADWHKKLNEKISDILVLSDKSFKPKGLKINDNSCYNKPFSLNATIKTNGTEKLRRPECIEQVHNVTFKPGLAALFYQENQKTYSKERKPNAPDKLLRSACITPTANPILPYFVDKQPMVLVESRSPIYTLSHLMIPGESEDAKVILEKLQTNLTN